MKINNKKYKRYTYGFMALAVVATLATAIPALADNTTPAVAPTNGGWGGRMHGSMMREGMKPGVFGTVTAISGNTITVTSKQRPGASSTSTTFTVDATNAKVMKGDVAGNVSSIVIGDTIMAQGTLTGSNLVATIVRDGLPLNGQQGKWMMRGGPNDNDFDKNSQMPPITGNGQPVVAGTVSSVNGKTITITNKSNVSYTVDTTNAKIVQDSNTSTSNIVVGDMVVVQGTVNGNNVVASSVIDQAKPATTTTTNGSVAPAPHKGGFFEGVGSFFAHIFGF